MQIGATKQGNENEDSELDHQPQPFILLVFPFQ
jgi:hypothetical protein